MQRKVTMFDLISTVSEFAQNEAELLATVVWMVNSGSVQLKGSFSGARFDLGRQS
jgi:hypothetical protein